MAAVYVADLLSLTLLVTLFFSNITRTAGDEDLRQIYSILIVGLISTFVDVISYLVDGLPGLFFLILNYATNSWLYLANILVGIFWIRYISNHLHVKLHKGHQLTLQAITVIGAIGIIVNCFHPIIFSISDSNVYKREGVFWIYVFVAFIFMLDGILVYLYAKKAGGFLKFFPIGVFIVPVFLGALIQGFMYGISITWACVAISIAGIMTASKNEIIFRDRLTGIYNRVYLDHIQQHVRRRNNGYITGLMIDLNDFKSINDNFGHSAGDDALVTAANVFSDTVREKGSVIRYAGDEFVILLNTIDENEVKQVIDEIRKNLEAENNRGQKPYKLSASIGYATYDIKNQSMNDFMNAIDRRMYEDKAEYYKSHGDRRKN